MTDATPGRKADTRTNPLIVVRDEMKDWIMPKVSPDSRRRARLAVLAIATLISGVIALTPVAADARVNIHRRGALVAMRAVEPALMTAATTKPTPPPAPDPVPPLPVPAPLPGQWDRVSLVDVGRIEIPKIGVSQVVHEGVEQMVIDAGPAHWPGTAAFGSWGNVVLAGHRTTHSEPFRRAAELTPGDAIILSDPSGSYHYRVTGTEVVMNTALWIVDQRPGRTLTIFTCHPIESSAQRLVVRAELISTPGPGY